MTENAQTLARSALLTVVVPPFHLFCRCAIIPYDKDAIQRGEKSSGNAAEGAGDTKLTLPARGESSASVEFNGKTVTRDNSLFDPNKLDKQGRTNVQRMDEGLAPIGHDGKSVNIHHIDQTNDGPVMEISATRHQQEYSILHENIGQLPSQINRTDFNTWRSDYWNWRSNDFK